MYSGNENLCSQQVFQVLLCLVQYSYNRVVGVMKTGLNRSFKCCCVSYSYNRVAGVRKTGGLNRSFKCYCVSYSYNRVAINKRIYCCSNFMEAKVSIIMSAKAHPILKQFTLVAKHNKKVSENS